MKLKIREKQIENEILSFLKMKGVFCFKVESQGTFDSVKKVYRRKNSIHRMLGISDICGIWADGQFLAIEVKSATGRLSLEQMAFLDSVNAEGGIGFMARSVDDVKLELGL